MKEVPSENNGTGAQYGEYLKRRILEAEAETAVGKRVEPVGTKGIKEGGCV